MGDCDCVDGRLRLLAHGRGLTGDGTHGIGGHYSDAVGKHRAGSLIGLDIVRVWARSQVVPVASEYMGGCGCPPVRAFARARTCRGLLERDA